MVPIIIVMAGKSNSGKTTLILSLFPELTKRGIRVGVVKHSRHFDFDRQDKDSSRLTAAGLSQLILASPDQIVKIEHPPEEPQLLDLAAKFHNVDLILAEGYKNGDLPKIEIMRRECNNTLYADPRQLLAVVGNMPEACPETVPYFAFDDVAGICNIIEHYIKTFQNI